MLLLLLLLLLLLTAAPPTPQERASSLGAQRRHIGGQEALFPPPHALLDPLLGFVVRERIGAAAEGRARRQPVLVVFRQVHACWINYSPIISTSTVTVFIGSIIVAASSVAAPSSVL